MMQNLELSSEGNAVLEGPDASIRVSSNSKDPRALRSAVAFRRALLCLLENMAFDQITVRDICRAAQVHYATFFRHYPTKEALLDDVARSEIEHLNRLTVAIRNAQDLQSGCRALCAYVYEHRTLWATLLNGGAGAAMREEWLRQAKQVADKERSDDIWLPHTLGVICAATLIAETLAWWVGQPESAYSVDTVAGILLRLLTNLITAPDS